LLSSSDTALVGGSSFIARSHDTASEYRISHGA
jgi:hypothetical protein